MALVTRYFDISTTKNTERKLTLIVLNVTNTSHFSLKLSSNVSEMPADSFSAGWAFESPLDHKSHCN
jgi:hypothetical protein